ncbi:hypothetical protein ACEQMD_003182 [Salmonella enterica]
MEIINKPLTKPEARIPVGGHWVSERMVASLSNWGNGGWFDIPNGWVSDAAGIVSLHAGSGKSLDVTLSVNGLIEAESHQGNSARGWCKATLVGAGATINFGVGGDGGWFDWCKFRRMW